MVKMSQLLGVHISSDFTWKIHVTKLIIELNKRIGLTEGPNNLIQKVIFSGPDPDIPC